MEYRPTIQKEATGYFNQVYDNKYRFISYWQQIAEITKSRTNSILLIGIGSGFLNEYLEKHGVVATTLDIDPLLSPTVVSSAAELPFTPNSFDVIGCFQVLEHLPYPYALDALRESRRVANNRVIISVPDIYYSYSMAVHIPGIQTKQFSINSPRFPPRKATRNDGEHFWELGVTGFSLKRFVNDIARIGFSIVRTYRVPENPYHRFFVLDVASA